MRVASRFSCRVLRRVVACLVLLALSFLLASCGDPGTSSTNDTDAPPGPEPVWGPWREVGLLIDGQHVRLRYGPWPIPVGKTFQAQVEVIPSNQADAESLNGSMCIVDGTMPHHGHGMNIRPPRGRLAHQPDGSLRGRVDGAMLFHMQGKWLVSVDVVRPDGMIDRASVVEDVQP
ncbi:MAG: hypothetical protein O2819_03090 [Planctomycetota bacterium]|nr:hypothetical protein [Planctomycetota bacterium]MDA1105724.1 hypothetical protein [Planctomycetota bacterium]